MGFIQDYQHYMSGTECPRSFLLWSSLALESAVCGRRVWVAHGDSFDIYLNLYVCLVGTPGSGKSVAKDTAVDFLLEVWPEYPISSDIQSHQHICRMMASDDGAFTWKNGAGTFEVYRPFFAVPDELQNFFATDKAGMMGFLVGVHSSKRCFSTGFKVESHLPQEIKCPYFALLGCAPPEWFMSNLKFDLFSGGAGRRFIIVHDRKTVLRPRPMRPPGAAEAYARIINHLKCLKEFGGQSQLDPAAYEWWDAWYLSRDKWPNREDPIVGQFHETKHVMLLKVATLLSKNEDVTNKLVGLDHLRIGLAMLDELEPKVIRLTSGIGRNVLAGLGAELLEKINLAGGEVMERRFRVMFFRHLRDDEWEELIKHYVETGELVRIALPDTLGVVRLMLFLPSKYEEVFSWVCGVCKRRYPKSCNCSCGGATSQQSPPPDASAS